MRIKTIVNKQYIYTQWMAKTARYIFTCRRGYSPEYTGKYMLAQKLLAAPVFTMAVLLAVVMPLLSPSPAVAAQNRNNGSYHRTLDIIDAVYLPGPKKVLVVGHYGLIGMLKLAGDLAIVEPLNNIPKKDFESVARISDNVALIGDATGQLFLFNYQNHELTKVAEISEFKEPVLDISARKNSFWAVGSRGLIAHSVNGKDWEKLEISNITQSSMVLPSRKPGTYYLGAANIDPESFKLNARINGKYPVPDVDYTLFPDEGTLHIDSVLDANAPANISFTFTPGPPFGGGDVSWNLVLQENGSITLAGEFGLVIQSDDGGQSWSRRNGMITISEQLQPYWLAGGAKGKRIVLAGAAGAGIMSSDGGNMWHDLPKPNKEGIFGVGFDGNIPLVVGAVGMVGTFTGNSWALLDRTKLELKSWLRVFVDIGNGTKLLLGGRSTSLLYKNKKWQRIKLVIGKEQS